MYQAKNQPSIKPLINISKISIYNTIWKYVFVGRPVQSKTNETGMAMREGEREKHALSGEASFREARYNAG
jgi:hypothetical protein